jgi:transglutaminase-like putative cysteine protease
MDGVGAKRERVRAWLGASSRWSVGLATSILLAFPVAANTSAALWLQPLQEIPPASSAAVPDILGTVALHIPPNSTSTRWAKVMNASLAQPRLEILARDLQGFPPEEQVQRVQFIVTTEVRVAAGESCSDDGYWAPAEQTLARGMGDCFDVAIVKMEALRSLGIPSRDLYLTTGRMRYSETGPVRETVDLLVKIGARFWLLPEWAGNALEVDGTNPRGEFSAGAFSPVITYGVGASWIHGRRIQTAAFNPTSAIRLVR